MPELVIAAYRPRPGKQAELDRLLAEQVPALRQLGYATARPWTLMRASDGTMVEVFEWASREAVEQAHQDPKVHALWERFEACSELVTLAECPWAAERFPHLEPCN